VQSIFREFRMKEIQFQRRRFLFRHARWWW
jgi:hypothetical protein